MQTATLPESLAPKLWTVIHEGYGLAKAKADIVAGLTVAIVALPLSMAIAIAKLLLRLLNGCAHKIKKKKQNKKASQIACI